MVNSRASFRRSCLWTLFVLTSTVRPASADPMNLRCEYLVDPLGIDSRAPRLSWQNDSPTRGWRQQAYQILVASRPELLQGATPKADVWDSGRTESSESNGIAYSGPALESRRRYFWTVRVWDSAGRRTRASNAAWWEMGLLDPGDWQATWISRPDPDAAADREGIRWIALDGQDALNVPLKTVTVFRFIADIAAKPANAVLYLTARGDFTASVNGQPVDARTRSWAAFGYRDITDRLVIGANTIEVTLVTAPPADTRPPPAGGVRSAVAGLLKIVRTDGTVRRFPTDARWEARSAADQTWKPAAVAAPLDDQRFGPSPGTLPGAAALLRRRFQVSRAIQSARLYVTALGSYRMFLNGQRIGTDVLTPEFTDYRKRIVYQTYDVTPLVITGENVIGGVLGDGWFASALSWYGYRNSFLPGPPRLLAQLDVVYRDGALERVITDDSWKASAAPILYAEIYGGEVYDARLEQPNWNRAGFDDTRWVEAVPGENPQARFVAQQTMAPRVVETLEPRSVSRLPGGAYLFDMGQNIVGWVSLRVRGPAGTRVRLRFAEILGPDGNIYRDSLRNADATDVYVLSGSGQETYSPSFTFHGFRYVEVTGYPGPPALAALIGEVVSSLAGDPTGEITTSSPLVNGFWRVGIWGQRGNFLSVPTDCPQRDERLGWTGDAGVFWRTGAYNFDIRSFTHKWMHDVADAQAPDGAFSNVAPHVPGLGVGAPGWGDAGVIVPWTTWMQYGDRRIVEEHWPAMERWMAFIQEGNPDFIRRSRVGPNFSDWLAPDNRTSKELVATAYWALIAEQMSQMARALGREADAQRYSELRESIRAAFQKAFISETGEVGTGTQTSYVLALYTRLAPDPLVPKLVDNLVKAIEERKGHLSTGFLGTPFLLFALADNGRTDVAYRLLLNETYPSWGYMLEKGATTWWERWNADTGDPAMNSYNHYAFGSVVAWVYRYIVGIDTAPSAPGFRELVVRPRLDPRMPQARGEYESVYGRIAVEWTSTDRSFSMRLTVPANTSAVVHLPARGAGRVTERGRPVEATLENGARVVRIGSGTYQFEVR